MWDKNSIFYQIALRVSILTLGFFLFAIAAVYFYTNKNEVTLQNHVLAERARTVASYLKIEVMGPQKGKLILDIPMATETFYKTAGIHHQFIIRDEHGAVLFASPVVDRGQFPFQWPMDEEPDFFEFNGHGTHYIASTYKQSVANGVYLVQVAESAESAHVFPNLLNSTLLYNVTLTTSLVYILLLVCLYSSIRWGLRSLNKVSADAARISIASPDHRIDETQTPAEIRPLVTAFNKALTRLEEGIKLERDFIANAAHELRTPLTILRCSAETIEDKEIAAPILKDIDSLSHLVQKLLDKAKLNGLQVNNFERVDLGIIVKNVCTDMWPLLTREGRALEVTGIDTPMTIVGDEWAIYRALSNLIENAINHTPKGTSVEITLEDFSIMVRDHGPGIPLENQKKIFQSFWRQDASKSNSSGLGLSIVKKTMELHGGTVSVENAPDGGAIFTLKFPKGNF